MTTTDGPRRKHPLEMTDEEFDEYARALAAKWVAEDTAYDRALTSPAPSAPLTEEDTP